MADKKFRYKLWRVLLIGAEIFQTAKALVERVIEISNDSEARQLAYKLGNLIASIKK